ncbi:MAG: TolC family protein [Phycisphaerae bacterium]|nr:TolC family protein [Phycisphaerae bacterium]
MTSISRWSVSALVAGCTVLSGCAHVNPQPDYHRVAEYVKEATNLDSELPADEAFVSRRIDDALLDGLSVDEAVQLCVINNPTLRAEYALVGIARADVVQSGLFSNPTLAFSAQFPEGGGRSNIQASLAQNIVDLWQIPVRKRAAERSLEEAILRLARSAAQLFVDTKVAYFAAVAADEGYTIARENQEIAQRLLDAALARQRAGVVSELDVNLNRQTVLSAQLEVRQARLGAAAARRRLGVLLGLALPMEELSLVTPLPGVPQVALTPEELLDIAREHRLDLRAARMSAEAAAARIETEIRKVFPDITIGPLLERNERRALPGRNLLADTARSSIANGALSAPEIQSRAQRDQERRQEIDAIFGPAFSLTLPIFDQNQAQIARARFAYEQSSRQVDALERGIFQEIRESLDQARTAAEILDFYQGSLLPQARTNLELSRASYEKGATSILLVLDAQRSLLTARRAAVTARQTAATSLAELERVTAQPLAALPDISVPTTQPATQPAAR